MNTIRLFRLLVLTCAMFFPASAMAQSGHQGDDLDRVSSLTADDGIAIATAAFKNLGCQLKITTENEEALEAESRRIFEEWTGVAIPNAGRILDIYDDLMDTAGLRMSRERTIIFVDGAVVLVNCP